uniref:Sulfatase N-terminal domain-containing protein n=1 Tax=Prasinoderma coloniale TaxID=156133 RepID=A0A7R9T981_9VIRI
MAGARWTGGVLLPDAAGALPRDEVTLAEALRDEGYRTAMAGKWHLGQRPGSLPHERGFDSYFGVPFSVDMGASAWRPGYGGPSLPLLANGTVIEQPADLNALTDRYAAFAETFVAEAAAGEAPFFLYLAFSHVHTPNFASRAYCGATRRGTFGDALAEMDGAVGRVMAALERAGAMDDTLVWFTSDNGPWLTQGLDGGSAGLLREGKQTTWEGGVRVPGVAHWRGTIAPGTVIAEVAASYDIFPTAMALAGAELPADRVYDGRDISALLLSAGAVARSPHDCLYIYKGTPGAACPEQHPNCPGLWAMRCGRHKIHWVTANSISPSGFSPYYPTAADTGDAGGMGADVGVVGRGLASSDGSDLQRTPWDLADLGWQDDGVFHDPPLIFDLEVDPSERFALDATSAEHAALRAAFEAARAAHEATLAKRPPENQMAQGGDPALALCCDPHSKERLPDLPNCTCSAQNFDAFVCVNGYPPFPPARPRRMAFGPQSPFLAA